MDGLQKKKKKNRCEISAFVKDDGVDLFFVIETWPSAKGDEAKTVELAPSGFDAKSFLRQSRSRCGGIATTYKCNFLKLNFSANVCHLQQYVETPNL